MTALQERSGDDASGDRGNCATVFVINQDDQCEMIVLHDLGLDMNRVFEISGIDCAIQLQQCKPQDNEQGASSESDDESVSAAVIGGAVAVGIFIVVFVVAHIILAVFCYRKCKTNATK